MWSEEFLLIRDQYREIGLKFQKAAKIGRQENHLPIGLWDELSKSKLFEYGLHYKQYDGLIYIAAALEGLSFGLLDLGTSGSLISHLGLCLNTIDKYCHPDIKQKCLDKIFHNQFLMGFAISEPQGGSNPQKIESRLIKANKGYHLVGDKWLTTNGPIANYILTIARERESLQPVGVIVDVPSRGLEIKTIIPVGMKSSPLAQIKFNDIFIPESNILGKIGDGLEILENAFIRERILIGFVCIGVTERILEIVFDFTQKRVVSGQIIANYQYIRKRITDILINLETTRAISHMTLEAFKNNKDVNFYASICKCYSADKSINSCINAVQAMGSYGLLEDIENSIGEHLTSAVASTVAGGTEEVHREAIYTALYRRYRKNRKKRDR